MAVFIWCATPTSRARWAGRGLSVLGYSPEDKVYTYREFNSYGEFEDARRMLDGDTWTWTSDEKMDGKTMKGRFTMKMTSATAYNFTFDMSQDGTKWSTLMDGRRARNKFFPRGSPSRRPLRLKAFGR